MNLLDLMIKVGIDDQASAGIDGIVEKAKGMGTAIKSGISAALGIGTAAVSGAAAGVTALTTAAVNSYADYEQLVGGVETLFKDSAKIIKDYADNAFFNAGASANKYMEMATGFSAILIQNLAGDTAAAAEMANTAIEDMSDNSNKFGTRLETVQRTYESLSRGAYMLLDNLKLGYGGTMGEMARLLNDANKIDSTILGAGVELATSGQNILEGIGFDQVIRAIHVIQENIGITGTTVQEAERTITGSATMVKAAWSDMLTAMANENADFGSALDKLAYSVGAAFANLIPRVEQSLMGIAQFVEQVAPVVIEAIPGIVESVLPSMLSALQAVGAAAVSAVREIAGNLITTISDVFYEFTGIDLTPLLSSLAEVGTLLRDSFAGLIESVDWAAVSSAIGGFLGTLAGAISGVVSAVQGDTFRGFVDALVGMLSTIGGSLVSSLRPAADGIKELFKAFLSGDSGVIQSVADAFGSFAEWFSTTLAPTIGAVASKIVELAKPFLNEKLAPLVSAVASAIGVLFGWFTPTRSESAAVLADAVVKLLSVFVDGLATIITNIATAIITFGESLSSQAGAVFGFADGLAAVVQYFTGILENIGFVGEKITGLIINLSDLQTSFEEVFGGIGEIIGSAVYAVSDALDSLLSVITEKVGSVKDLIGSLWDNTAIGGLMKVFSKDGIANINDAITSFGEGVWSGYRDARGNDITTDIYDARNDLATKTVQPGESTVSRVTEDAVNAVIQSAQRGDINITVESKLDGYTVAKNQIKYQDGILSQMGR